MLATYFKGKRGKKMNLSYSLDFFFFFLAGEELVSSIYLVCDFGGYAFSRLGCIFHVEPGC